MIIDRILLRCAKPENLERLARSLGLDVPPRPTSYYDLERWSYRMTRDVDEAIDELHALEDAGRTPPDRRRALAGAT